jgi:hypothetical protein
MANQHNGGIAFFWSAESVQSMLHRAIDPIDLVSFERKNPPNLPRRESASKLVAAVYSTPKNLQCT